ncbi:MAG TPA: hypothetical protein DCL31_07895 [Clostridium sp.]|nr:hypothetical protein [Clostridium sp.]
MDTKNFLSRTMRKKAVSLAISCGLLFSILIGSTIPVNAVIVSKSSVVNSAMIQSTSSGTSKISDRMAIGRTENLIITNQLIDDSILDDNIKKAVDIDFISNILANDLEIKSCKIYNNGSEVEFFVTYESGKDRYVSFFNAPDGDIFMKTSGGRLSAGKNNLKFKIPVEHYNSVKDGITMKFWETSSDKNFIWFNKQ